MKVLLINPPVRTWAPPNWTPLGLLYVAAALHKHGHECTVYDINALRHDGHQVREFIRAWNYDWVGIGGIITTYNEIKELARTCRCVHPDRPIMVGGPVGNTIPELILKHTHASFVCMGEGERVAVDFCDDIDRLEGDFPLTDGLSYRTPGGSMFIADPPPPLEDLDTYKIDRDLIPMHIYLGNPLGANNPHKWETGAADEKVCNTNLISSRGCPYRCTYCCHNFIGYAFRQRAPEKVVEEMVLLKERYGCTYLNFSDDLFMANPKWVLDFCTILSKTLDIKWGCTGRVNIATRKLLEVMKDAGCVHISYGVESGSQTILDAIKKGTTVRQAEDALRWTREVMGRPNTFSMMVGFPQDTEKTLQESVDFCKRIGEKPEAIFFVTPYPGTQLYKDALDAGLIGDEEEYVLNLGEQGRKAACNMSIWPDARLVELREMMIEAMTTRPSPR